MARYATDDDACHTPLETIADDACLSVLQTRRVIDWMVGRGHVEPERNGSDAPTYRVTPKSTARLFALEASGAAPAPASAFDRFWRAYPRKVGKGAARKSWRKIAPPDDLADRIVAAVAAQSDAGAQLAGETQYVPHPSTWLNSERWEDDVEVRRVERDGLTRRDGWLIDRQGVKIPDRDAPPWTCENCDAVCRQCDDECFACGVARGAGPDVIPMEES